MKIAMLYASWEKFGEPWSTPLGVRNELESRGHEVKHFNLYHDDGMLPPNKIRRYSNHGVNQLFHSFLSGSYKPDVIFVMDYGPWDAVQFDKQYFPNVILVSEAGDEPQSHRQHWAKAGRVHLVLSPDMPCVQRYHAANVNAVFWTHFADTRVFYKRDIQPVVDCVTTCGGRKFTAEISKALGNQFNNERYFFGDAHAERLHLGKIVFQNSQHGEITRRVFEGMACGRMVLTDRLPEYTGMQDLFVDECDIVYYDSAQDAIDKIRYYASHDDEREQIALNGYNEVMANHTVSSRIDTLEAAITQVKDGMPV